MDERLSVSKELAFAFEKSLSCPKLANLLEVLVFIMTLTARYCFEDSTAATQMLL